MKKIFVAMMFLIMSCTPNTAAKNYGGTETINLPECTKLVNVTWKENQLWYLTRPMTEQDQASMASFQEKSSWGLLEGTVNFIESCPKK